MSKQTIPFKKSPIEHDPDTLSPSNLFDLLPKDHDCYIYKEILQQLDTTEVERKYSPEGQHAYPPNLRVSLLIFADSPGVLSAREIEITSRQNHPIKYICEKQFPKITLIIEFRKNK
jgi:transposase